MRSETIRLPITRLALLMVAACICFNSTKLSADEPTSTDDNVEYQHAESFKKQLADSVDESATETRDGVLFLANSDAPFTGWVKSIKKAGNASDSEQVTILKQFRRGKQDGPTTLWYREQETGQKGFVIDGQRFGTQTQRYSNKQKKSEVNLVLWKIWPTTNQGTGIADITAWHENGQKNDPAPLNRTQPPDDKLAGGSHYQRRQSCRGNGIRPKRLSRSFERPRFFCLREKVYRKPVARLA